MKKVLIIMGSDSDLPVVRKAAARLETLGVGYEMRIASAHRTPELAHELAANAEANGFGVIIAAAGKAAHLGGVLAAYTTLPVLGIPMKSSTLDGLDSLLSMVQMPSGIPVGCMAIDGADNAGIFAAQILAVGDAELTAKLKELKQQMADGVAAKDRALQESL